MIYEKFPAAVKRAALTAIFLLSGVAIGLLAWADHSSPALALVLPLFWIIAPGRIQAFALTLAYHLTVSRFLPAYAKDWFKSVSWGFGLWFATALVCALAWALLWPKRTKRWATPAAMFAALLLTLLPPLGVIFAGHPLVGLGFLWQGGGWLAILIYFLLMPALGYALVHRPKTMFAAFDRTPSWALVACLGLVVGVAGTKLDSSGSVIGHSAGQIVAVNTAWGGFPTTDDEIIKRATEMGATSRKLASGFKTVIFPEAVLGVREVGNFAVFKSEVLRRAARDGQVIVVGAYLDLGHGRLQNAALVFRPDGTNSEVIAKQTPPLATWNPTAKNGHVPANWLAKATTNIAPGINARIMLCYEEYIVFFHLLSEAREDQQIVVSIANRWASHDELSSIVQAAHTEGMARLFDRPWVRAENNALPTVTLHEFKY